MTANTYKKQIYHLQTTNTTLKSAIHIIIRLIMETTYYTLTTVNKGPLRQRVHPVPQFKLAFFH